MKKYKVCVYAICKNEEQFVDRWMDSMSEADLVVVTDTGSEDGTVERLRERGATVHVETIKPWRFDVARNISLAHVPEDVDICVCTDLDEVFSQGWREKLEKAWGEKTEQEKAGTKVGRYLYNWSVKPDGTPGIQMHYSKIHERNGFQWRYPIHEWIHYVGDLPLKKVFIEGMVLSHYPDTKKSRSSYLPLLEMAVEENPMDDRMRYYLGREYMYAKKWKLCIDTLNEHLLLPTSKWDEERCASMRWMAYSYHMLGNNGEAYYWYFRAIEEAPHMREPYIEFAKLLYKQEDWNLLYCIIQQALTIDKKSETYVNMDYCWDFTPYDLGAIAAYHLKLYKTSLEYAERALEFSPENKRLMSNYQIIKKALKQPNSLI